MRYATDDPFDAAHWWRTTADALFSSRITRISQRHPRLPVAAGAALTGPDPPQSRRAAALAITALIRDAALSVMLAALSSRPTA